MGTCTQFGGGSAEGSKKQKLSFFEPIDRKSKVVQHVKKSTPLRQPGGEIWVFLALLSLKRAVPPYLFPLSCFDFSSRFYPLTAHKNSFCRFSHFLNLFLAQLPFKLGQKLEITYVHLVGAVDVPFGVSIFQPYSTWSRRDLN